MKKNYFLLLILFLFLPAVLVAQQKVTGKVTDKLGEPIVGANVVIKGTFNGTTTDVDGTYQVSIPQDTATLVFQFIGMKKVEKKVRRGQVINVILLSDAQNIEEVVVTAFGTKQKKVSMVGSVQTIRPAELSVPAANLSAGFAGRLAGVVAVQRSGEPGADGADFWIRGIASVNASNPLIVLDGVEISAGDLNAIDPEIIEGFSVLKDATATALYGSKGANGVVIVSTKTGRDLDKPIINFSLEGYMNTPTSIPDFVDGATYMEMFNEAITNLSTGDAPYSRDRIAGTRNHSNPYAYPDVNWYDELFHKQSFNQKANFNIRGGGKKLDYFMSVTADHQTGMLKNRSSEFTSYNNELEVFRYAFQNNIRAHLSKTSQISLRLNAQIGNKSRPGEKIKDIFGYTMDANPVDFPVLFPKDENLDYVKWGSIDDAATPDLNPVAKTVTKYAEESNNTLIANLEFKQDLKFITKGLSFTALASFKNWTKTVTKREQNKNYFTLKKYDPNATEIEDQLVLRRLGDEQNTNLRSKGDNEGDRKLYFQSMFLYDRNFGKHGVSGMVNYYQEEYSKNIANDDLLNNLPRRRQGIAARASYNYDNKYLFEINCGYNGSENFADKHRFGFFPSVAVGYNVSEEKFWEPISPYISLFKIRASYGLVGNDKISGTRFPYLSDIKLQDGDRSFTTGIDQSYTLRGPKIKKFENRDITWEVGYKANIGVDLKILRDLSLSVDIFQENRTNVFTERGVIPTFMGTAETKIWGNLAEVENKGIDASLEYGKKINDNLTITAKGTFTFARNEITKWDEPLYTEYPQLSKVGHRLKMYQGYIAERLFIDEADVAAHPRQIIGSEPVQGGDIKYLDLPNVDGVKNGVIDGNDKKYIGDPQVPEIIYGFGISTQYKAFDFSFFFQGVDNTSLMMEKFHPFGTQYNRNVLQFIADDYWSATNQNIYAKYPRLTKLDHKNNTEHSTYWLRDAAFLKLKNIEIGYTYKNIRFYARGQNVLTFSDFDLWDPEMGGGKGLSYPTQRVYSLGLRMTIK